MPRTTPSDKGSPALVITCEHGGNEIPAPWRSLFEGHRDLLDSHRGFDPGALCMAQTLAEAFAAPVLIATTSRLLVDLNRSPGHRTLHLESVARLPAESRARIVAEHYQPYRSQAETLVMDAIARHGHVVHIASHSFTPELDGKVRRADVGLLYDPARSGEVVLCDRWKAALSGCAPALVVRRNDPYRGRNDGLTSWFRKRLAADTYVGIELELNQKHVGGAAHEWKTLREQVIASLRVALAPDRTWR